MQAIRLSRSFALPQGRGCRRIEGAKGHASSSAQQELRPPEGLNTPRNAIYTCTQVFESTRFFVRSGYATQRRVP